MLAYFAQSEHFCVHKQTDKQTKISTDRAITPPLVPLCTRGNDDSSSYKSRLLNLHLLPLINWLELLDVLFLVKQLKEPADNFNIFDCGIR